MNIYNGNDDSIFRSKLKDYKIKFIILPFIILLCYIIYSLYPILEYKNKMAKFENAPITEAYVDNIGVLSNSNYYYKIIYSIGDESYVVSVETDKTMQLGEVIEIKYLVDDPYQILITTYIDEEPDTFFLMILLFPLIGVIGFAIYGANDIRTIKRIKIQENLRKLKIDGFEKRDSGGKKRSTVSFLICIDSKGQRYYSNVFINNESDFIIGDTINMYIDPNNSNLFFIDTREYLNTNMR